MVEYVDDKVVSGLVDQPNQSRSFRVSRFRVSRFRAPKSPSQLNRDLSVDHFDYYFHRVLHAQICLGLNGKYSILDDRSNRRDQYGRCDAAACDSAHRREQVVAGLISQRYQIFWPLLGRQRDGNFAAPNAHEPDSTVA